MNPDFEKLLKDRTRFSHRQLLGLWSYSPRYLQLEDDGPLLVNLSSNDYLALSAKEEFADSPEPVLLSQPSSRLLCGDTKRHKEAEHNLAQWLNLPATLLFSTGYMANAGALSCLAGAEDLLLFDRLNHASLVDGARLCGARLSRYRHLDMPHLELCLKRAQDKNYRAIWVVSESLFSMDGDSPDFHELARLKKKYGFYLLMDEAHAMGLYGDQGQGLLYESGLGNLADVLTFTLSKSFALQGGVVAGSLALIQHLINHSRMQIFTTATPSWTVGRIAPRLERVKIAHEQRQKLENLSRFLAKELGVSNDTNHWSPIIPLLVGKDETALKLAYALKTQGFYSPAILPPTVPPAQCRLRFSLNAGLEQEDLEQLLKTLKEFGAIS